MALESIRYSPGTNSLSIIDQLRLPHTTSYLSLRTAADAWHSIRAMNVRGAPAIAIVAVLALAVELRDLRDVGALPAGAADVAALIRDRLQYLVTSRPTAVNLADAAGKLGALAAKEVDALGKEGGEKVMAAYVAAAERMVEEDVADNRRIGEYGARWVKEHAATAATGAGDGEITVLTHCNTGSLATAGYGTALGVIRSLHAAGALARVFCTETRPYNQGARLTAYELVHDRIPATLITDSMAAALLAGAHHGVLPPKDDSPSQNQTTTPTRIAAIIVGADRIAANGDTANKIGTYSLAVLARAHGARFVVAAPRASIDLRAPAGTHIRIEQRPAPELTRVTGPVVGATGEKEKTEPKTDYQPPASSSSATVVTAADGIDVWNPAFDVTPATLIDAIVTEVGIAEPQGPEHGFRLAELLAEAS